MDVLSPLPQVSALPPLCASGLCKSRWRIFAALCQSGAAWQEVCLCADPGRPPGQGAADHLQRVFLHDGHERAVEGDRGSALPGAPRDSARICRSHSRPESCAPLPLGREPLPLPCAIRPRRHCLGVACTPRRGAPRAGWGQPGPGARPTAGPLVKCPWSAQETTGFPPRAESSGPHQVPGDGTGGTAASAGPLLAPPRVRPWR